jgi:hypothetical protein
MLTDRIVLRPRSQSEAMDLGFHLARASWPGLAGLTAVLMLPGIVLAALLFLWHPPLALVGLWWLKPLADRALLHWLAQALLGGNIGTRSVLTQWRQWAGNGLVPMLTLLRFHPARSAVLPVWQLERLSGLTRRRRTRALGHGGNGSGSGLSLIAGLFELCLVVGLMVMLGWMLPDGLWEGFDPELWLTAGGATASFWGLLAACYALSIVLVEPFYVGGGFGIYLNQRCRLECWDLEPAFRGMAEQHAGMARS